MVARPMGCYLDRQDDKTWGLVSNDEDFPETIRYVTSNRQLFSPREYYSKEYTLERCREKWTDLITEFVK
jgi:glycosyltransferase involved in cell wall biosynthesis